MSATDNKQAAEAGYRAFAAGDGAAAMENMDDAVEWKARGDSAISGTYKGKQQVGELWARMGEKGLKTEPHAFIADGDKVVVLTTVTLDGEAVESADVLTYNDQGKLIAFEQFGDPAVVNRVFPA
jgi:uncharacterized protein